MSRRSRKRPAARRRSKPRKWPAWAIQIPAAVVQVLLTFVAPECKTALYEMFKQEPTVTVACDPAAGGGSVTITAAAAAEAVTDGEGRPFILDCSTLS